MRAIALTAALFLAGCTSAPVEEAPPPSWAYVPQVVMDVSGKGQVYGRYLGRPITATFRVQGEYQIIGAPVPPYLSIVGDGSVVVEPLPGDTARANEDVVSGRVAVSGAALVPAGTMDAPQAAASSVRDFPPAGD